MIIWLAPFMWRFTLLWGAWLLVDSGATGWLALLFFLVWMVCFARFALFLPSAYVGIKTEFTKHDRVARNLLLTWLPWKEKLRFYLCAKIRVTGSNGKHYSISPRRMNAVRSGLKCWCGVPGVHYAPLFDDMLAQYLVLQNNAEYFHKKANGDPL